ncbi:hypothetical protein BDF14DRAFT_462994 [Spinellus fusiger]|nr:hypothetical protein BDF14DRAFT_462994 [Spinellus fusiger]
MFKSPVLRMAATSFVPSKIFIHSRSNMMNIKQAREVFKKISTYGELIEYRFQRCPESKRYLRYGYATFKHAEDANKIVAEEFIKIESPLFNEPCEITCHLSANRGQSH